MKMWKQFNVMPRTKLLVSVGVPKLTSVYYEFSEDELLKEITRLKRHLTVADIDLHKAIHWSLFDVLQFIAEWNFLEHLPTVTLSLQLFFTICVLWLHVSRVSRSLNGYLW